MERVNITIIGAGVVGLSAAYELSKDFNDIIVLEKNSSFGQETSSRNSEVIHAGIYYPKNSLKASTCIEGRDLLYEFCQKNNIPHKKIGKLIVANTSEEIKDLQALFEHAKNNGVVDLKLLSKDEIKKLEPNITAGEAILSPSSGILDSHKFMQALIDNSSVKGVQIVYNTQFTGLKKTKEGFEVCVEDKSEEEFKFISRVVINCAGLYSDKVSEIAGIAKDEYKIKYCKGDYFRVSSQKSGLINRLIYPVPHKKAAGLGVHATLDLSGGLRLGPDDEYVKEIDYRIDESKKRIFSSSVKEFLPFIEESDLSADTSGIRPKLQGPDEDFRDFIIKDECENSREGFINLIGIESPGLTSSIQIAKLIKTILRKYLI